MSRVRQDALDFGRRSASREAGGQQGRRPATVASSQSSRRPQTAGATLTMSARPQVPPRTAMSSRYAGGRTSNWASTESSSALYVGDNEESSDGGYDDEFDNSPRRSQMTGGGFGTPAETLGQRLSGTTMLLRQKEREQHQRALKKAESVLRKDLVMHEEKVLEGLRLIKGNHHKEMVQARLEKERAKSNEKLLSGLYRIALREPEYGGKTEWAKRRNTQLNNRKAAKRASKRIEMQKLDYENQLLLRRLRKSRSQFSQKKWQQEWKHHKKMRKNLSKMAPSAALPSATAAQKPRRAQTAARRTRRGAGASSVRGGTKATAAFAGSGWNGGAVTVTIPEYDSTRDKHNKFTKTANFRRAQERFRRAQKMDAARARKSVGKQTFGADAW